MKNTFKTVLLSLCLLLSYAAQQEAFADNKNTGFINITYLNGLTTNSIYDIETDPSGSIWIGTSTGLSRYDGYYLKNYFKEEMNIRSNTVKYLLRDRQNRLWIGTSNGVGLYDIDSDKFMTLDMLSGVIIEKKTAGIFEDSHGTIWISFRKGGLISIDPDTFSTRNYFNDIIDNEYFARVWFEPENNLYLAAKHNNGLFYLDPEKGTITPFSTNESPEVYPFENRCIRGLIKVNNDSFCVTCTEGTMWLVNPYDRTVEQLPLEGMNAKSVELRRAFVIGDEMLGVAHNKGLFIYDLKKREIVDNDFADTFIDKNVYCIKGSLKNGLIVGTFNDGVSIQQERPFSFSIVKESKHSKKVTLKESNVTGFAQTNDTTIFVSTSLKGLFRYDINTGNLKRWASPFIPKSLEGVVSYKGNIWLWTSSGVYRLNMESKKVTPYREGYGENTALVATGDDRLVLLSDEMLLQYDGFSDSFVEIKELKDLSVLCIGGSESSSLVAITKEKGLIRWNGRKIIEIDDNYTKYDKSHKWMGLLFEDSSSHIWSAPPESGIFISSDKGFSSVSTRSGLSSDIITNIIKDDSDNVFITTDRNLSMITPEGKMFSMTKSDGLLNFGFTRNSSFKTKEGEILLGSRDGFTIISKNAEGETPAAISDIKAIDKLICDGVAIPVNDKDQVKLRHNQNSFHVSVMDIDPHTVATGKSLFCLEGYDHTWIPAGNDRKLSYLNLKPGRYTFRAYNSNIRPVEIKIGAHPLMSVTAYVIYAFVLLALMGIIIMYIRDYEIRKRKEKTLQMKVDLHQEKIDFFTNIAHEIKTPLTLITTPLNHLKNNPNVDADARYDIEIMDKHASYLSTLIRELLEFSKIEKNRFNISCKAIDINRSVRDIIANFAEQNTALDWRIDVPDEPLWVMGDSPATTKILNNLLFNAIKYADTFVEINVSVEGGHAAVCIENDGDIIPQEMRDKIFDTFVQFNSDKERNRRYDGFGIGLSVAKNLAELQGGNLRMSEDLDINGFIFNIPLTEAPVQAPEKVEEHEDALSGEVASPEHTVLIVEDNKDLLEYIRKTLSQQYRILTAENGVKALDIIERHSNIDLVVTDLKMPEMSGMELCMELKQNHTYSHILVVILSANLTPEVKIESLKNGADAMIEKPFSMEFLQLRIENLISSRKKLIERISANDAYEEKDENIPLDGLSSRDIVFLRDLSSTVEDNFNDPEFGVEELAVQLNISRSSLNRKMRDILNTTANNYIRDKKIEKAEELLRTSSMQINEICYKVGFTTPSYFIKCFRKRYGMSPNEYANSIH